MFVVTKSVLYVAGASVGFERNARNGRCEKCDAAGMKDGRCEIVAVALGDDAGGFVSVPSS